MPRSATLRCLSSASSVDLLSEASSASHCSLRSRSEASCTRTSSRTDLDLGSELPDAASAAPASAAAFAAAAAATSAAVSSGAAG
eukprot:scaffold103614_cov18-Phaeocystis_antarctica.AAC.1